MILLRLLKQARRFFSSPIVVVFLLVLFMMGFQFSYLQYLSATNERLEERLQEVFLTKTALRRVLIL